MFCVLCYIVNHYAAALTWYPDHIDSKQWVSANENSLVGDKMHRKSKLCPIEIIRSIAWTKKILSSLTNYTVILQQLISLMTVLMLPLTGREHCSGICGEPFFHDVMIFFCLNPCKTFHSHTWLMTDLFFYMRTHFIYQIQIIMNST